MMCNLISTTKKKKFYHFSGLNFTHLKILIGQLNNEHQVVPKLLGLLSIKIPQYPEFSFLSYYYYMLDQICPTHFFFYLPFGFSIATALASSPCLHSPLTHNILPNLLLLTSSSFLKVWYNQELSSCPCQINIGHLLNA